MIYLEIGWYLGLMSIIIGIIFHILNSNFREWIYEDFMEDTVLSDCFNVMTDPKEFSLIVTGVSVLVFSILWTIVIIFFLMASIILGAVLLPMGILGLLIGWCLKMGE